MGETGKMRKNGKRVGGRHEERNNERRREMEEKRYSEKIICVNIQVIKTIPI